MTAANTSSRFTAAQGFLLINTVPTSLAFSAAKLLGVFRATEWSSEPPVPLSALVPIRFAAPEPAWVLRVTGGGASIATLVSGAVHIDYLQPTLLLSMPSLIRDSFKLFSDVILTGGSPSALVINTDALFQLHRELGT